MESAVLVILLALVQFTYFSIRVGASRTKYGVNAPSTSGDENWERLYRVQQNTMEQLAVFIPSMLAFSFYVSTLWALLPGVLFLVGRQLYSYEYVGNPASRAPGMAMTFLANGILLAGGLIGVFLKIF
jgi:glutathione S-transferase